MTFPGKALASFIMLISWGFAGAAPLCSEVFQSHSGVDLINQWTSSIALPFKAAPEGVWERWLFYRENKKSAQFDLYQMSSKDFRNQWLQEFVDLRMKRLLWDQLQDSSTKGSALRKAGIRLALRSAIEHGIEESLRNENPSPDHLPDRLRKVVRLISAHPMFRLMTEFKLPLKTLTLTEEQTAAILAEGLDAFDRRPDLAEIRKQSLIVDSVATWNRRISFLVMTGFFLSTFISTYESTMAALDAADEKASNEARQSLDRLSERMTLIIPLVQEQMKLIEEMYFERFHRTLSQTERTEAETTICRNLVGSSATSDCLRALDHPSAKYSRPH